MAEAATEQTKPRTREALAAEWRRVQAEFAEATKDLSEDEYEALVERLTNEVNDRIRRHVLRSRGELE